MGGVGLRRLYAVLVGRHTVPVGVVACLGGRGVVPAGVVAGGLLVMLGSLAMLLGRLLVVLDGRMLLRFLNDGHWLLHPLFLGLAPGKIAPASASRTDGS